jgi:fibronectin-binding autotransporter adhesin
MKTYDSSSSWNEEPPSMAKRRGSLRIVVAIFAAISFWAPLASQSAIVNYLGSGDLDDKKSWSTQTVPTSSDSAVFTVGNSVIQSTGALDFGNFVWNNNTSASISLKASGITRYLTLSGAGDSGVLSAGGSTGDLLVMGNNANTNTLKFEAIPGNGELQIRLAVDGNINVLKQGATLDMSTVITGGSALTKTGNGTLILRAANTYNGTTAINSGSVSISSIGNVGEASAAGAGSTIKIGSGSTQGTLTYTGSGGATSNKTIDLAGTTGTAQIHADNASGRLLFTSNFTSSGIGAKTLNIRGTGQGEIAGSIVDSSTGNASSVSKMDAGTWTLSGNNSFTGNLSAQNGNLIISSIGNAGQNSAAGAGSTINIGSTTTSGTLTYTGSAATTDKAIALAGTTGNATIVQNGTGLLRFTSNFTSASGSKTLILQGAGVGEVAGALVNNSLTNITSLTKNGSGTWTLSGNNTYTGATTINAGTLQFAKSASLYNGTTASWTSSNITVKTGATLALNIGGAGEFTSANVNTINSIGSVSNGFLNNSTLALDTTNAGGSFTHSGNISNTNGGSNVLNFAKNGSGKLLLTGNSTYTGTTTINAGTLEIGSSGRLGGGNYSANIANNATFVYSGTNSQTLSGVISGTGALTQNGSGRLRLTGNNTYQGSTTISVGTLEIGSAGRLGGGSYSGNIANNATFLYSGTNNQTLSGVISGTGALTQNGSGRLRLTGNNTYQGKTTVQSGTLHKS